MKQVKHALIIMLLSLIYINVIEEINATSLKNLYYTNSELSIQNEKGKKVAAKKTKGKAVAKKGKKAPIKCKKGDKKCLALQKPCKKVPKKCAKIPKKCKKGDKKCVALQKACLDLQKKYKKCLFHKKHPYGAGYLRADPKNVHIITINFYVRLLKMIGDKRGYAPLKKLVSHKCNNINIFAPLRESLLNCRAIAKRIKKDKSVMKSFYMGCMANLFRLVRTKCPKVFDKSTSAKTIGAAIMKLSHVEKKFKHRFQVDANIFVKKISFFLRIFSHIINKRFTVMQKLRAIAAKKAAIKRAKMAALAKIKKAKALALKKLKKDCAAKKKKGTDKKDKKCVKLAKAAAHVLLIKNCALKKKAGTAKKDKKCVALAKAAAKELAKMKKAEAKKAAARLAASKILHCKPNCKKGFACKKVCKKVLVGKWTLKPNTKKQKLFVKEVRLDQFKGNTLAALFGKWIMHIVRT
jgi:hypothetical protein